MEMLTSFDCSSQKSWHTRRIVVQKVTLPSSKPPQHTFGANMGLWCKAQRTIVIQERFACLSLVASVTPWCSKTWRFQWQLSSGHWPVIIQETLCGLTKKIKNWTLQYQFAVFIDKAVCLFNFCFFHRWQLKGREFIHSLFLGTYETEMCGQHNCPSISKLDQLGQIIKSAQVSLKNSEGSSS